MYTALVLTQSDQRKLKQMMAPNIPEGWEVICHHVTLNMGAITDGPNTEEILGTKINFGIDAFSINDKVCAVRVSDIYDGVKSVNATPHITVAVNRKGGGKPFMSNQLSEWEWITPQVFSGIVQQVG